jgi:hypothetical protein
MLILPLYRTELTDGEGGLARDGADGGGVDELRVFGQNASGVARGKRLPARAAGTQLGLIDE